MRTSWIKIGLSNALVLSLAVALFSVSCSRPAQVEPQEVTPAQYELKDVHYFLDRGDHVDTVTVKLDSLEVYNRGNSLSVQQVEKRYDQLVKKSLFVIDQSKALPQGVNLEAVDVKVPEIWYADGSYGYFSAEFTLSRTEQQKPYGAYEEGKLEIRVAPKSKLVVSRAIDAYHLVCSFNAVLENSATGQRYPLTGKWKGIVRYNNLSTVLKEYRLEDQ